MVKTKVEYQMSFRRQVTIFDQENRQVVRLDVSASRGGVEQLVRNYSNDEANREINKKNIKPNEINPEVDSAIDRYFDQPGKHEEVDFGCLLKGWRSTQA